MLAVAVKVEYRVGHSRSELAVSDTVQVLSGWFSRSPCGLAGIEAPVPAPGEDGGRTGAGFPAGVTAVATRVAALAAAVTAKAASRPGRASAATASPARRYPCITTSVNRILPPRKDIRPLPHSAATLALYVIKVLLVGVTSWRSDTSGP